MNPPHKATLSALVALLWLCACDKDGASDQRDGAPVPGHVSAPATPTGGGGAAQQAPSTLPSASRNPRDVLAAWGKAVEARDWHAVRRFWGDNGAMSGMDEAHFIAKWSRFHAPRVTIASGAEEGAAGSLYYTAPVTITDGSRVVRGEVSLRRVNDVPGATPEQLRWHILGTTFPL